jgi:hypothetical protein
MARCRDLAERSMEGELRVVTAAGWWGETDTLTGIGVLILDCEAEEGYPKCSSIRRR